jgi:hypothetical protein
MKKHEQVDETDAINAKLDRIAQEDAEAENRLSKSLLDNTFSCSECGNQFDIDDSRVWRGVVWICQDCLQILEHAATDEPAPLD